MLSSTVKYVLSVTIYLSRKTMSTGNTPPVLQVLASCVHLATKAGQVVKSIWDTGNLGIVEKESAVDLQTKADRITQQFIVGSLLHKFPTLKVIGEEDLDPSVYKDNDLISEEIDKSVLEKKCPDHLKNCALEDFVVWVDPLDGTKEFTEGFLDHVTTLIGISLADKAVGGVVAQPYYNFKTDGPVGRVIWALEGMGVVGVDTKLMNQALDGHVIATTRSHGNKVINDAVQACTPTEVLRVGGAGHKVLLIIDGKAQAYVFASYGCKRWDTCAPEVILKEAGGQLTDVHGNQINYDPKVCDPKYSNKTGVIASRNSGKFKHQWYVEKMPENVKQALQG